MKTFIASTRRERVFSKPPILRNINPHSPESRILAARDWWRQERGRNFSAARLAEYLEERGENPAAVYGRVNVVDVRHKEPLASEFKYYGAGNLSYGGHDFTGSPFKDMSDGAVPHSAAAHYTTVARIGVPVIDLVYQEQDWGDVKPFAILRLVMPLGDIDQDRTRVATFTQRVPLRSFGQVPAASAPRLRSA